MTNCLPLGPIAHIAMPTFSLGPIKRIHKSPGTANSRSPVSDELIFINDDAIVCCCPLRRPAAPDAGATSIERPLAAAA
jgi:hypothetical protein